MSQYLKAVVPLRLLSQSYQRRSKVSTDTFYEFIKLELQDFLDLMVNKYIVFKSLCPYFLVIFHEAINQLPK